jgi:hypothetical protein
VNFLFTRQDLQRLVEPARFERRRMLAETIDDLYEYEWTCAGPSSTVFGAMRPLCTTGVLGCPLSATAPKEALHRSAPTQSQWGSATSAKSRTPNLTRGQAQCKDAKAPCVHHHALSESKPRPAGPDAHSLRCLASDRLRWPVLVRQSCPRPGLFLRSARGNTWIRSAQVLFQVSF